MKSGKVILGVLIGTTAGALMGILFAPGKGAEARNKITKMGRDYTDIVKKKFGKSLDDITVKINKAKIRVSELEHQARAKVDKLKKGNGVEIN